MKANPALELVEQEELAWPWQGALVLGADGLIGAAVLRALRIQPRWQLPLYATTRRRSHDEQLFYDLSDRQLDNSALPKAGMVFLCAGISGFKECEGNPLSWRVNVDGIIGVALQFPRRVYVSTDSVEWSNSEYSRQRAQVEAILLGRGNSVIVRCGRVTKETAPRCADAIVRYGFDNQEGVFHWP